jgi:inorganic triphosphatase YgiF
MPAAAGEHVEVELKYELGVDEPVPDLLGTTGVAQVVELPVQELTAVYFDTPSLDLAQHRVTLRRRSGGDDDGWHLKLPLASGARLEVRRPLGRAAAPPSSVTRLLVAVCGGRRVQPVATIVTQRRVRRLVDTHGTVLAEMADDLVAVEHAGAVERWRELEVELVDGDAPVLAGLDEAVRASGIRRSSESSKVGRVLAAEPAPVRWSPRLRSSVAAAAVTAQESSALRRADAMARAGRPGAEGQLLDALGRVRAALALGALLTESGQGGLVEQLAASGGVLRRPATVEAAGVALRDLLDGQHGELVRGPVARRLDRELAAARRQGSSTIADHLGSPQWLGLLGELPGPAGTAGDSAGRDRRLARTLPAVQLWAARELERRARAASEGGNGERAEALAAAVLCALTDDLARRSGVPAARAVGPEARELGESLHELEVTDRAMELLVGAVAAAQGAGESTFTLGRLHALLEVRSERLRRRVRRRRKRLRRARRALT